MVDRVELQEGGIFVTLSLERLLPHERVPELATRPTIMRLVPTRLKHRGIEMRLVIEGPNDPRSRSIKSY